MRALWLVSQLWVIVPVSPRQNRASSELLYKSNRPQVSLGYNPQKLVVYCLLNSRPTNSRWSSVTWIIEIVSYKTGDVENFSWHQAGFSFFECEMQRQGTRNRKLYKKGSQSASYLWSRNFFRAHSLFVFNVIFEGPRKENKQRDQMAKSLGSFRSHNRGRRP